VGLGSGVLCEVLCNVEWMCMGVMTVVDRLPIYSL